MKCQNIKLIREMQKREKWQPTIFGSGCFAVYCHYYFGRNYYCNFGSCLSYFEEYPDFAANFSLEDKT